MWKVEKEGRRDLIMLCEVASRKKVDLAELKDKGPAHLVKLLHRSRERRRDERY